MVERADKWEKIRRLRYGDVLRLIRHRYGVKGVVPNDDAGRPDLWELLCLASMAPAGSEEKVRHCIDLHAPWMQADEVEAYLQHLAVTPTYQKLKTSEKLGRALHLSNADRERLRLWRLKPIDMTDAQLAEQAKARSVKRKTELRRRKGVRTRAQYLAELKARPKPWEAVGLTRRTWQRRVAKSGPLCREGRPDMSRGEGEIILIKAETHQATQLVEAPQGQQGKVEVERLSQAEEAERLETEHEGGLGDKRPHLATREPHYLELAMQNWGVNAEKREGRKNWSSPQILFDELRDFAEFPQSQLAAA